MSDTLPPSRPKIEVVRLPSCERAKLRPLLEGGVQLKAQYQHMRYGDYASYSSLEESNKHYYRFPDNEYVGHKTPLATKSLDNIFARQLTGSSGDQSSPFLWRDATRSEEQLYHAPHSFPGATYRVNTTSRFSAARSRITALLKKLSPRLRHKPSPPNSPCPWVVVEFSNQDLDSPDMTGRADSISSDYSFDMAVQANRLRTEQIHNQSSQDQLELKSTDTGVPPQVLVGSPKRRNSASQGSIGKPEKSSKHGETRRHRTSGTGLAAMKYRPAFNTGSNRQVSGGTAAAKVKAKVAATSRPHSLRIQLSSHHQHNSSMASDESIGSCSLDADATASDASECVDVGTVSARTLRSLQISTRTPDPDSVVTKSPGGASTPEYVKRTARLFEPSETARNNGKQVGSSISSDVPSVVVNGTNSTKTADSLVNGDGFTGKKPSYLGLACSISGYSGITTYDSKLREGFRSRDHSPGRLGIIKSRDVSPLRPSGDQVDSHLISTYKSDCGNFLVAPPSKTCGLGSASVDKVGLVSPPRSEPNILEVTTPSSDLRNSNVSKSGTQTGLLNHINGDEKLETNIQTPVSERTMEDEEKFSTTVHHTVNGVSEKLEMAAAESNKRSLGGSRFMDNYSGSTKQEFFSNSASNIRESTRNFMSSMLTTDSSYSSTHYESSAIQTITKTRDVTDFSSPLKNSPLTSVPRDSFGAFSPIKRSPESPKTVLRDSPSSRMTSSPRDSSGLSSPLKHSPESPKTSSKDSLSAPAQISPQKRSPGAVRVVEFTSQTKSYVRTAFVSGSSVESSAFSDSTQPRSHNQGLTDGSQTNYVRSVRSSLFACGSTDSEGPSDTSSSQANGSNSDTAVWTSKSFIQQRVERLYGPGALAQGFFRRTRHKPPDEIQGPSENYGTQNGHRSNSSPALPVLRHLRPEFRAQLSLGPAARKLHERDETNSIVQETNTNISKRSSAEVIPLQQQISVESLTESLTDLQPAAPEVVLPIDQSQSVSSQSSDKLEDDVDITSKSQEKDGHYFLKLLKQEIERLNGYVESAEADLNSGESLPEEALGKLRAASGQARLLIRQKLQQFEGLCHKNIAQSSEEPFPTTSEDLAGFWDMVMLQVEQVNRLFEEIMKLKAANWVEAKVPSRDVIDSAPKRRSAGGSKRSSAASSKNSASSEAARKAREEGRRKMMEERRRAMKEKRDAAATPGQVEIFIPQENGK